MSEVSFLKEAMNHITIKAALAPQVAKLIDKLDKELERLEKLQLPE